MEKRPQIDFVYFDLGCVLIGVDKDIVANELDPYSGLKRARINRIFSADYAIGGEYEFWRIVGEFDRGRLYPHQFYEKVCRALKLEDITFERFLEIWKMMLTVDIEMWGLANILRTRNMVRLGIISDLCVVHYNTVMNLLKRDAFDICFFSFLEGCLKRENNGVVFKRAIRAANVPADKILFIDDRGPNIKVAASCGLRVFHFKDNPKELKAYLESLGCDMTVPPF